MGTPDQRFRPIGDLTVLDLESQRQIIQERLDTAKTAAERNRLGQFATPPNLALDIARYALGLWQGRTDAASFLDPAIGSGSFYSALRQTFPAQTIADACGVEIDPPFADAAKNLWGASGLRIIPGDFTRLSPDRPYNLILTNPPYVRHHHLDRSDKERLKTLVADRFGLDISGLAGLYAHFLLLCDAWMAPGGLAVWLIPSEFMDVNYGAAVKTYLTENVKLLHIHRYCPSDVQFCDALVTSAIVVFEKSPAPDRSSRPLLLRRVDHQPRIVGTGRPGGTPKGEEMDRPIQGFDACRRGIAHAGGFLLDQTRHGDRCQFVLYP